MTVEIIIKEVRENKGISLKELEEDTGIDRRRLAKIENGEVPVDKILFIEMLVIAQNLGTKITDLYRTGEIVVVGKDRF
ncbi:MAG TPA: helix-turn-helix transcriptional regulator [Candidatus Merdicola faecigallinarum]|uniref:Helix-turn-helix transcriptional regulator n=1 Tax=Candidatus Merdicola faecigallinarum TaxID=2840862 RepID=A0A9D1S8Q1_9FIRM|nr:helix-turn-helix transcriptional regulator [Candidatus Merdicola faecigallinarum]